MTEDEKTPDRTIQGLVAYARVGETLLSSADPAKPMVVTSSTVEVAEFRIATPIFAPDLPPLTPLRRY